MSTITRSALVGGGGSGIGWAVAARLASTGSDVMLMGRDEGRLADAARRMPRGEGTQVAYVVADVTHPDAADLAVKATEHAFGHLDVLVLNAGGPPPGRILSFEDEHWYAAMELLLLGPLRFARRAMPDMARRGFGRVVITTSTAVRQPQPDLALSAVVRAAVTSAATLLSREYADAGVTVNCVAPGATDTERRREILRSRAAATGSTESDVDRADAARVPAGRAARPGEIAAAVAFLASDDASYVNGTVLTVDGGATEAIG